MLHVTFWWCLSFLFIVVVVWKRLGVFVLFCLIFVLLATSGHSQLSISVRRNYKFNEWENRMRIDAYASIDVSRSRRCVLQ